MIQKNNFKTPNQWGSSKGRKSRVFFIKKLIGLDERSAFGFFRNKNAFISWSMQFHYTITYYLHTINIEGAFIMAPPEYETAMKYSCQFCFFYEFCR